MRDAGLLGTIAPDDTAKRRAIVITYAGMRETAPGNIAPKLDIASADLTVLRTGRAPLLAEHRADLSALLGVVETAWREDDSIRALVRFGHSQQAEAAWRDVQDGVLWGVSVGYMAIPKLDTPKSCPVVYGYWQPWEISLCVVGADHGAHVLKVAPTSPEVAELLARVRADQRAHADLTIGAEHWTRWTGEAAARLAEQLGIAPELAADTLGGLVEEELDRQRADYLRRTQPAAA